LLPNYGLLVENSDFFALRCILALSLSLSVMPELVTGRVDPGSGRVNPRVAVGSGWVGSAY